MKTSTPFLDINLRFLKTSQEIINNNILNIPIHIDKNQIGTENLYPNKSLNIFINNTDKVFKATYKIKKLRNNIVEEYLQIENINTLQDNNITFDLLTVGSYNEFLTDNNLKHIIRNNISNLKTTVNDEYQGNSGLLEPEHLSVINSVLFNSKINELSIYQLNLPYSIFFVEKDNTDKNISIQFKLKHLFFESTFEILLNNDNNQSYQINQKNFRSSNLETKDISFNISLHKGLNNLNTKQLYRIDLKIDGITESFKNNILPIDIIVIDNIENIKSNKHSKFQPLNFQLQNNTFTEIFNNLTFNRNTLYYDINGVVNIKHNESIKLNGHESLNNLLVNGWYHYDELVLTDSVTNDLPFRNIFKLNVSKLSNSDYLQFLYIKDNDSLKTKIYSRIINGSLIGDWIEFTAGIHTHNPSDINTNTNNRFVTDEQINRWDSVSNQISDYWKNAVSTINELPENNNLHGSIRLVLDIQKLFVWNATHSEWRELNKIELKLDFTDSSVNILLEKNDSTDKIILPIVSDSLPGLVTPEFNNTNYKQLFESKLNFTIENAGTEIPGNYEYQLEKPFNIINNSYQEVYDGVINYINPLYYENIYDDENPNLITNRTCKKRNQIIIDLSSFNYIKKTFYSKFDNTNYIAGIISSKEFVLKNLLSNNVKLNFDTTIQTVIILKRNNEIITLSENEYVLDNVNEIVCKMTNTNFVEIIEIK